MDQQVAGEVVSLKDEAAAFGIIAAALVLNGAVVPDIPDRQRGRVLALLRDVGDGDGQPPTAEGGLLHRPDYDVHVHHHGHLSQRADSLLLSVGQLGLLDGDGQGFAGGDGFQRRFVQFHGAIREPDRQSCVLSIFGFGNDRGGQLHAVYLGKPGEIYRHRLCPSAMTLSISFPLTDTVAVLPEIVALSLVPPWSEDTGTVTDGVEEPPPPPLLLPPPLLGSLGMTVPEAIFSPQPKQ